MKEIATLILTAIGGFAAMVAVQLLLTEVISIGDYATYVLLALSSSVLQFGLPAIVCKRMIATSGDWRRWQLKDGDVKRQAYVINQLFSVIILIVMCQPVVEWSYYVSDRLCGWAGIKVWTESLQVSSDLLLGFILRYDSVWEWGVSILTIAVVPAVCEELFFRGTLLPMLQKRTGNWHLSIVVTAAVFSLMHLDIVGFLPRFLLGVMLGLVYYLCKGNMVMPVVMHTLNNLIVVVSVGVSDEGVKQALSAGPEWPGLVMPLVSLGIVLLEIKTLEIIKNKIEGGQEGIGA
jgi:membrane protease YdiL (CAAX protease family)